MKTLQKCEPLEEDPDYQVCEWKIGYYEDYIERGLANPWQTVAAFVGGEGWEGIYQIHVYYYSSAE